MNQLETVMARFAKLAEEAERREAPFALALRNPDLQDGPCPKCNAPAPLDHDRSLEESGRNRTLTLVYDTCEPCQREARIVRDLKTAGVPHRVLSAKFDNYRVYDKRQVEAVRMVRAWIADPEKVFLVLLGSCGTGKGHLAASAARSFISEKIRWRTHDEFIGKCHALDFYDREDYLDGLSKCGLLVLDEIGARTATADTPERFYRVLDKRYDQKRKTILIGNVPMRSADGASILSLTGGERMESRIVDSGVVVPCLWGDFRKMKENIEGLASLADNATPKL